MRKIFGVLAALALGPGTAEAHAFLKTASPAVGSTIATGPRDLRLEFNEAVNPASATVTLAAEDGKDLGGGQLLADTADPDAVILRLPAALPPGTYRVSWIVVTEDKAKTQGSYSFHVSP
jgi:copper resistance protein C